MQRRLIQFDWAIKHLLRNKANFAILEGFLSELLCVPIIIERILESESNKSHRADKSNKVDILALTNTQEKILIELQVDREWDYLHRMLYGASKLVTEYIQEGETYGTIRKIIAIQIVFFDLGRGEDYIYHGRTVFEGVHLQDRLTLNTREQAMIAEFRDIPQSASGNLSPSDVFPDYYIIKVNKFRDTIKNKFDEWVYFIKNSAIPDKFDAQGIKVAKKKLDVLSLSDSDRKNYEFYLKGLHDKASEVLTHNLNIRLARDEGLAEGKGIGLAEGLAEGEASSIRKMFNAGIKPQKISEILQIDIEQVEQVLSTLK
jgi:predicted transposase/invertase (TIGR01784 family)